jgi:hypothetical protein
VGHDFLGEEDFPPLFRPPPLDESPDGLQGGRVFGEFPGLFPEEGLYPAVDLAPGPGGPSGLLEVRPTGLLREAGHLLRGHARGVVVEDVLRHEVHGPSVDLGLGDDGEDTGYGGKEVHL